MVIGIDKFKEYFKEYPENYIIIGGTACDIVLAEAGLIPRATKDIDMILIVEALKPEFAKKFWDFIKAGEAIDSRNINKHKTDIFRLATLFTEEDNFNVPYSLKNDLLDFVGEVKDNLPDKNLFKDLGIAEINVKELFQQFISNFNLDKKVFAP